MSSSQVRLFVRVSYVHRTWPFVDLIMMKSILRALLLTDRFPLLFNYRAMCRLPWWEGGLLGTLITVGCTHAWESE
jgi:hypothetical protein